MSNTIMVTRPTAGRLQRPLAPGMSMALLLLLFVQLPGLTLVPVGAALCAWRFPRALNDLARRGWSWSQWMVSLSALALLAGGIFRIAVPARVGVPGETSQAVIIAIWVASLPLMAVAGSHAVNHLGVQRAVAWLMMGAATSLTMQVAQVLASESEWRQLIGVPMIALSTWVLVKAHAPRVVVVVCVVVGSLGCFAVEQRSLGSALLCAGLLAMLPRLRFAAHPVRNILVGLVSALVLYWAMSRAMAAGLLGRTARRGYLEQTKDGTEELILAGRRELDALAFLASEWWPGYGLGTVPSLRLRLAATQESFGSLAQDSTDYFARAVLTDRTDLHSIAGNLWYHTGLPGLAVAGLVAGLLLHGVATTLSLPWRDRLVPAFLLLMGLWTLLFSPMASGVLVGIAAALAVHSFPEVTSRADERRRPLSHRASTMPKPEPPSTDRPSMPGMPDAAATPPREPTGPAD